MKYNFENRIFAVIDILGYKNLSLDSSTQDKILDILYEIRKSDSNPLLSNEDKQANVEITSASDSIYLSVLANLNDNLSSSFYNSVTYKFLEKIREFQIWALSEGIILRGAISSGEMYWDPRKHCYRGHAFNEALDEEKNVAKYPRIILCRSFLKYFYDKKMQIFNSFTIDKHDGIYFLDYLQFLVTRPMDTDSIYQYLLKIRKNIMISIEKFSDSGNNILSKWVWLAKYYNKNINNWNVINSANTIEVINNIQEENSLFKRICKFLSKYFQKLLSNR